MGRFLSQDTYSVNFGNPVELNRYVYTANNPINGIDPSGQYVLFDNATIRKYTAIAGTALVPLGYFLLRTQINIAYYFPWLVPWNMSMIFEFLSTTVQFALKAPGDISSWLQTRSAPQTQSLPAQPKPQLTETPESGKIVVELGSGDFSNLPLIKAENSGAQIIGIVHPEALESLNAARETPGYAPFDAILLNYNMAVASGVQVEFLDYTTDLPKLGIMGQVDKVISIAPSPGKWPGMASPTQTAMAAASLVKPGGKIYIAADTSSIAEEMALYFRSRYGINVEVKEDFRFLVPYKSPYLDEYSTSYIIDFQVP